MSRCHPPLPKQIETRTLVRLHKPSRIATNLILKVDGGGGLLASRARMDERNPSLRTLFFNQPAYTKAGFLCLDATHH
ncbi:MAG: hypothetical protein P8O22_10575, partial [Akkermansiaceae bacterium]|nr:hypothetical protein [Akkermansiaceae bacterium]